MAGIQAKVDSMQVRQDTNVYVNTWHTTLLQAVGRDCPYCCFSVFCPYCVSYLLRKRTLYNDMTRYTCCGGFMPCSGKCKEKDCPEFCLCLEVVCCFASSVASTRFLLQDEFRIQTTACDNCIIATMFFLQYLACLCQIAACLLGSEDLQELANCISWISDLVYCSVCACMQTQHKVELDKRDGKFAAQGVQPLRPPQVQEMNRFQTGPPGYPQGGPPGYPQGGPPGYPQGGPPGYGGGPPPYAGAPGYGAGGPPPGYPPQYGQPGGYTTAPPPQAMQYGAPPPGYPQAQQFSGAPAYTGAPYK